MNDIQKKATEQFTDKLKSALDLAVADGELCGEPATFAVEQPADVSHGDLASNIALVNAKRFRKSPRDVAAAITARLELDGSYIERVEVAGAGFINAFLNDRYYADAVALVLERGEDYGKTDFGAGERVNVEFVSANPTGPMHIGNARGGALGDCLAAVLGAAGYEVEREFYVNDAGNQIHKFGISLEARYLQHFLGDSVVLPADAYQGADITAHAEGYIALHGDKLLNADPETRQKTLVEYALPLNMVKMKSDLARYRIEYDTWFHESSLYKNGEVDRVIALLRAGDKTYERGGALWFMMGDEPDCPLDAGDDEDGEKSRCKDFVLVRSNGFPTYIVPDVAYHYNKLVTRNFKTAITILGADHHGHVARLKSAVSALGIDGERVEIVLMQLVKLVRDGEQVRMSKRTGKAISLDNLLDEVPLDAARFFFNMREPQSHLEFDLELAAKTSSENPVYYVQYAHARICSIMRALENEGVCTDGDCGDLTQLKTPDERAVIRQLAALPSLIVASALARDPATLTRYCVDLATMFHKFYTNCRVKDCEDCLRSPRITLCRAVRRTLRNCLTLLKIDSPETM